MNAPGTTICGIGTNERFVSDHRPGTALELRRELSARNVSFATNARIPHVLSYGSVPVVVYCQSGCGRNHGNFIAASYRRILKKPAWRRRLEKVHAQANHCLPKQEFVWRELDSCTSSDALLMNIFCYPGVTIDRELALFLGTDAGDVPQFGFLPRVPPIKNISKERK